MLPLSSAFALCPIAGVRPMTNREEWYPVTTQTFKGQWHNYGYSDTVPFSKELDPFPSLHDSQSEVGYLWLKDTVNRRAKFKDNPFYLERANRGIARSTTLIENNKRLAYDDTPGLFVCDKEYTEVVDTPTYASYDTNISDHDFCTLAAERTNPSKAEFDVPIFLAELKDIPGLFKNAATKLTKASANEYLKFEYGWKPLYRDMNKFMNTMDKIERRIQTLSRLQDMGRVRRRYDPPTGYERHQVTGYGPPLFTGSNIRSKADTDVSIKRWADVIWIADPLVGAPKTDQQLRDTARRAMLGGKVDGSTMWELMPWSWLVDWSTNMSEYISSQRNIVGARVESVTLMKTTIITSVGQFTFDPDTIPYLESYEHSSSFANSLYIIKERIPGFMPSATSTNPFAPILGSERKSSIIGALSMQRLRRMQLF